MLMTSGMDISVFKRDAMNATFLAFAISSAPASTSPKIFFWFGQIKTQTLKSMIVPSQAPMPIVRSYGGLGESANMPRANASSSSPRCNRKAASCRAFKDVRPDMKQFRRDALARQRIYNLTEYLATIQAE